VCIFGEDACAPGTKGQCLTGFSCDCLDATSLGCPGASYCTADADHQETITIALP
jgi:hypothetical protein